MDHTEKILKDLTEAFGPPGFEDEISSVILTYIKDIVDEIKTDKLGSIVAVKRGKSDRPRIMFIAHMDEIGLMVKGFTQEGYVKFLPLGGWWSGVLIDQMVVVKTKSGKKYFGIVGSTPPHLLRKKEEASKLPELDDLWIDFGVDTQFNPKEKLEIEIGDPIAPYSEFKILANEKIYSAKAFDNRYGAALLIRIFEEIKDKEFNGTVYGVFSVQEEVGLRGAGTSSWLVEPDVGIALDVSISEDTPAAKEKSEAKMGNGCSIVVLDYTMIGNRKLINFLRNLAQKENIKYHIVAVPMGGYDTGRVHLFKEGVPSAIIGVPTRYIHGFHALMHRDDFDNALKLSVSFVMNIDSEKVKEFSTYL
ncbi:MAG: M42 family metallopeptidase [Candidatus Hydrothermales bacterium]